MGSVRTLIVTGALVALCSSTAEAQALRVDTMLAPCPGPSCTAAPGDLGPVFAKGPRVVWLDFEGATLTASATNDDAAADVSFILSGAHAPGTVVTIPPFSLAALSDAGGMTRSQLIDYVKAEMEAIHAPYDIYFVLTRPASGNYQRLIFGGTCASVSGGSTCAGVAVMDCGDSMLRNIGYAHPAGLRYTDLVTTAAQEMAHAYGLNHTTDNMDIMFPQLQNDVRPVGYGAGPIPMDETGCGGAIFQDSHALLLGTVGPFGQDVTKPTVSITAPGNGELVAEGVDVTIAVTASDDEELVSVSAELDGMDLGALTAAPFEWPVTGLDRGEHTIVVRALDASDNAQSATLTFHVGECVLGTDCGDGFTCQDNLCVEGTGPGGGDGNLGDPCTGNEDCASGICGTVGGDSRCTEQCDTDGDCPTGFECLTGGACWQTGGGGGGGGGGDDDDDDDNPFACLKGTVSPASPAGRGALALIAAVALLVRRRKRHR